jgi:hypothetical protein
MRIHPRVSPWFSAKADKEGRTKENPAHAHAFAPFVL